MHSSSSSDHSAALAASSSEAGRADSARLVVAPRDSVKRHAPTSRRREVALKVQEGILPMAFGRVSPPVHQGRGGRKREMEGGWVGGREEGRDGGKEGGREGERERGRMDAEGRRGKMREWQNVGAEEEEEEEGGWGEGLLKERSSVDGVPCARGDVMEEVAWRDVVSADFEEMGCRELSEYVSWCEAEAARASQAKET